MDPLLAVKVGCLVALLVLPLVCGLVPAQLPWFQLKAAKGRHRRVLGFIGCFAAGVFLGACLMHMVADALADIQGELGQRLRQAGTGGNRTGPGNDSDGAAAAGAELGYPFAELVVACGFFLVFLAESLVLHCCPGAPAQEPPPGPHAHGAPGPGAPSVPHSHGAPGPGGPSVPHSHGAPGPGAPSVPHSHGAPGPGAPSVPHSHGAPGPGGPSVPHSHGAPGPGAPSVPHSHGAPGPGAPSVPHSHGAPGPGGPSVPHSHGAPGPGGPSPGALRALALFAALSLHSLFEGLAVGLQRGRAGALQLCLAVLAHKGVLAFSLGLRLAQGGARPRRRLLYLALFALASPAGLAVGIGLSLSGGAAGGLATALLEGVAAGTFLYVTFLEILPHELRSPEPPLAKFSFLALGFILMALIAVWA